MKATLLTIGILLIVLSLAFMLVFRGAVSGATNSIIAIIGIIMIAWSAFSSGEKVGGQKM